MSQREFWLDRVQRAQTRCKAASDLRDAAERALLAAEKALRRLPEPPTPSSKEGKTDQGKAAIKTHRLATEEVTTARADLEAAKTREEACQDEVVKASDMLKSHGTPAAAAASDGDKLSYLERRGLGVAAEAAMRDPSNRDFGLSVEEARQAKEPGALTEADFKSAAGFLRQPTALADERRRGHQEIELGRYSTGKQERKIDIAAWLGNTEKYSCPCLPFLLPGKYLPAAVFRSSCRAEMIGTPFRSYIALQENGRAPFRSCLS